MQIVILQFCTASFILWEVKDETLFWEYGNNSYYTYDLSLVGFVVYSISSRSNINYWGRRSLFVLAYGLVICCFAAARDGLDKTIQYTIDGSCNPGIFSLVSVPNIVGCVGAAIIIIAAIATPIAKSQHMREIWFYVMSGGVMLKIVVMEIARIIQMF